MRDLDEMRAHPAKVAVLVGFVAATVAAWWFAPLLGIVMTVALGAVIGIVVLPEVFRTVVRGPGYQYREPPS
jgi:membrane protein YdbS with pleckstrin-like domain